jgi:hypothetical protein
MPSEIFSYDKAKKAYDHLTSPTTPAEKAKKKWAEAVINGKESEAIEAWEEYRKLADFSKTLRSKWDILTRDIIPDSWKLSEPWLEVVILFIVIVILFVVLSFVGEHLKAGWKQRLIAFCTIIPLTAVYFGFRIYYLVTKERDEELKKIDMEYKEVSARKFLVFAWIGEVFYHSWWLSQHALYVLFLSFLFLLLYFREHEEIQLIGAIGLGFLGVILFVIAALLTPDEPNNKKSE